jgi:hypothetical protein
MSEYINVSPSPASLIQSLRDIGYSIQTAIADIIDNSITAHAGQIEIRFSWNFGDSWLAIIDDGNGMTHEELVNAMRFGSNSPLEIRTGNDLGRFGLGMKTASFSQCRHLIVLSKKKKQISCCEWDLDSISKSKTSDWMLGILNLDAIHQNKVLDSLYEEYLANKDSGTIVFWKNIDRMYEEGLVKDKEKHFNSLIDDARTHLQLVFHRFLSPDLGSKKVFIMMNGDELIAFNPFNPQNLATQELEQQQISIYDSKITAQPYILPHHNKVSREEYEKYAGEGGYLQNQGFYIYRNKRLIIKGTWFRLIKKEELNKLIRIRIDIPNTLDHLWKIDVRKSHASPPEIVKEQLLQVIEKIEMAGRRVYKQKGTKLSTGIKSPVWNRKAIAGEIIYEINREHPLIMDLFNKVSDDQKGYFQTIITMLENSFPVDLLFHDMAGTPELIKIPNFDEKGFELLLDMFIESWAPAGDLQNRLVEKLFTVAPFSSNIELTKSMLNRKGYMVHE